MARPFDPARFEALRAAHGIRLGAPLVAVTETGSTNDDALAAARAGEPHGALFVAEHQTRGRGRRGSLWHAPPGENLTFSVLLRPRLDATRAAGFSLVVGLALREACASLIEAPLAVKWPNDLLAGRHKLAGVLVESSLAGSRLAALVVGVGLNVHSHVFPSELRATSLALLGAEVEREALLVDVLASVEARTKRYESDGLASVLPELGACDALRGARIAVDDREGVAAGIDEDGALLLRTEAGGIERVLAGHVRWLD